jgi:hypothetical protein
VHTHESAYGRAEESIEKYATKMPPFSGKAVNDYEQL